MLRSVVLISVLIGGPAVALAQQPCTTDARQVVNEIYRHMLERAPDPGSAGWVDKLSSGGMTVRELVREIAKSPEHLQRFGGDAQAVGTLYRHILGRQPDAAGQRTYAALASSRGLAAVVDQIIGSQEYEQSFGDWGVPGSGGITYCARGAAAQNRTSPDRNQGNRNPSDQSPADRNQGDRNQGDRNQADRGQGDRYPSDRGQRGQGDRYPSDEGGRYPWDRDYADRSPAYRNPPDRFEYLDRDNDRFIERQEWDGGRDVFERLDRNRDGRLSRSEFNAGDTPPATFYSLDTNHDRRITLSEWPWSHRSFDEQDLNGDGVITRDEFRPGVGSQGRF